MLTLAQDIRLPIPLGPNVVIAPLLMAIMGIVLLVAIVLHVRKGPPTDEDLYGKDEDDDDPPRRASPD